MLIIKHKFILEVMRYKRNIFHKNLLFPISREKKMNYKGSQNEAQKITQKGHFSINLNV